jgi:hypothetical protein
MHVISGGTSLCKFRVSRDPRAPFKKLYHAAGFPGFLVQEAGKTGEIMKFLERGPGRDLFTKRSSPDYFFERE